MANPEDNLQYLIQLILEKLDGLQSLLQKRKKPFLTIQEASEYLGISRNTLYGYTSKGIIPFYKLRNRKIYFRIIDLNKFVLAPKNRMEEFFEIGDKNERRKSK